jgi:hypothetical protein
MRHYYVIWRNLGGGLSDERTGLETEDGEGILVNISDADYRVYTVIY